ncbi:hypothetical protein [Serratia quinivorans]
MTEITYSGLPTSQPLAGTEILSISQLEGSKPASKKTTLNDVKAFASIKSAVKGGNWSSSYANDMAASNAHGKFNTGEYWKTTLALDKAARGSRPPLACTLQAVPCDASGEMLPYNLQVQYKSVNGPVTVIIILTVYGTATQVRNLDSGEYSPLGESGGMSYEPKYSLTYWY